MERFATLTGRWLGRYGYAGRGDVVPFEALLTEADGALDGETHEPNTFRDEIAGPLAAVLRGGRDGASVNFVKLYTGFSQGDEPIYDGQVNAALTRIEGSWRFRRTPWITGPFSMMRKPLAAARKSRKLAVAVGETVR